MKKYIEVGIGNPSLVSSEIEWVDPLTGEEGEERVPGIIEYNRIVSVYLRVWVWKRVLILDSAEGGKWLVKSRPAFKLLLGLHCR